MLQLLPVKRYERNGQTDKVTYNVISKRKKKSREQVKEINELRAVVRVNSFMSLVLQQCCRKKRSNPYKKICANIARMQQ